MCAYCAVCYEKPFVCKIVANITVSPPHNGRVLLSIHKHKKDTNFKDF